MVKKSYDNCFQFIFTYIIDSNVNDVVKTHLISIVFFFSIKLGFVFNRMFYIVIVHQAIIIPRSLPYIFNGSFGLFNQPKLFVWVIKMNGK